MKARKIWIAQHPHFPGEREVRFSEPAESGVYIETHGPGFESSNWVEWQEFVLIPVETD